MINFIAQFIFFPTMYRDNLCDTVPFMLGGGGSDSRNPPWGFRECAGHHIKQLICTLYSTSGKII